jgi:hypothetical protein
MVSDVRELGVEVYWLHLQGTVVQRKKSSLGYKLPSTLDLSS